MINKIKSFIKVVALFLITIVPICMNIIMYYEAGLMGVMIYNLYLVMFGWNFIAGIILYKFFNK